MARFGLTKSKRALIGVVATVVIAGGAVAAYLAYRNVLPSYTLQSRLVQTEEALADEGIFFLATFDADYLETLEDRFYGKATYPALARHDEDGQEHSYLDKLQETGIDLRQSVSAVSVAAYLINEETITGALVVHGKVPVRLLRTFLEKSYKAHPAPDYGKSAWIVQSEDKTTCQLSRTWLVVWQNDRVIVTEATYADRLLGRLKKSSEPVRDLRWWKAFREHRFASIALFLPENLPEKEIHPFLREPADAAKQALDNFDAVYFGVSTQSLPPSGKLSVWLAGYDENIAATKANRWKAAVQESKKNWQKVLPTIAILHNNMKISVKGSAIMIDVPIDKTVLEKAANIPSELLRLVFAGLSRELGAAFGKSQELDVPQQPDASSPAKEVLAENMATYLPQYSLSALKPYNPKVPFAEVADVTAGPFGINLTSVALSDEEDVGAEITVESFGTGIANLGNEVGRRVALSITSVQDKAGNDLLIKQTCGKDRNDLPADAEHRFDDTIVKNKKTVRVVPTISPSEVQRIKGYVRLRVPVKTETVGFGDPKAGDMVEKGGVRLEITEVSHNSVSYRVSGTISNLLEVRALNGKAQPLASGSSSSMGALFGGGKSVSREFRGKIAALQAIIATKNAIKKFPFEIIDARPKNPGERVGGERMRLLPFSVTKFEQSIRKDFKADTDEKHFGETGAGPFILRLESVQAFFGLRPSIKVIVPSEKYLDQYPSVVELVMDTVTLGDGTQHQPTVDEDTWRETVSLSKTYGKDYLRGRVSFQMKLKAEPEQLNDIRGKLILHAPLSIKSLTLEPVEVGQTMTTDGSSVMLTSLARNGFSLEGSSAKTMVLAVEALNAEDKPLWVSSQQITRQGKKWEGNFSVSGVPSKIVIYFADKHEQKSYPFTLSRK